MSDDYVAPSNLVARIGAGVVGGLAGGVVLGAVLLLMGEMSDIGKLVGSGTTRGAWLVLGTICIVAGGLFGALFGTWISRQLLSAIGIGLLYGGIWWALLPLSLVPLRTGGKLFDIDGSLIDLAAYAAFGIVTAVIYAMAGPRRRYWYGPRRSWGLVYATPRRRRRKRDDDDD